jgi:microcystin-dependent protein
MDNFIGEIRMVGFNFAPKGWAFCNGQLLPIQQNSALFALLGTTYGGNGSTTFALPNMQSRMPMHVGTGPGLSQRVMGEASGTENVTLIATQVPPHTHPLNVNTGGAEGNSPSNTYLAQSGGGDSYAETANGIMNPLAIGPNGGGQPHDNMPPYLVVNFIIALTGIFPSRS